VLRKAPVAQTESLPDVASASALGGADVAVVDYSGVVRRYRGARQTAVLDVDAVVEPGTRPLLFALHGDRLGLVIGQSVAIIDTRNGALRKTHVITDPDTRFAAVAALPTGGRFVASMGDRSLRVYSAATGKLVDHAMTDALSSGIAISPDGTLIAQVDALTGVVSIRDMETLRTTGRDLVAPGFVTDLTWLDHGRRIATSSTDGFVHYWDVAERKQLAELPHGSKVEYVLAAADGSVVYSEGIGVVRQWDLTPPRAARAACAEAGRNLTRDEWDTYLVGETYRQTCP
jgi:DNA-binding beta-propeller fold protein YncE